MTRRARGALRVLQERAVLGAATLLCLFVTSFVGVLLGGITTDTSNDLYFTDEGENNGIVDQQDSTINLYARWRIWVLW